LRVPQSFVQSGTASSWYQVQKIGNAPATSPDKKVLIKLDCPGGNRSHNIPEQNRSLTPPTLSFKEHKNAVMVTIEAYENMAAQDEITLRWGDLRMDLPAVNAQDVGKPITLKVPPAMILEAGEDPALEVTYCVIDLVGNNSRWAPTRALSIPTSA